MPGQLAFLQLRASLDPLSPDDARERLASFAAQRQGWPLETCGVDLNAGAATADVVNAETASNSWPLLSSLRIAGLKKFPDIFTKDLSHFRQLTLVDNVTDSDVHNLLSYKWPALRDLSLDQCQRLSSTCLSRLANSDLFSQLLRLAIGIVLPDQREPFVAALLGRELPKLEELRLTYAAEDQHLNKLSAACPALTSLAWGGKGGGVYRPAEFRDAAARLKTLHVSHAPLPADARESFFGSEWLSELRNLNLYCTKISANHFGSPGEGFLSRLQSLRLEDETVTPEFLTRISQLPGLESLDLSVCRVTELQSLSACKTLRRLSLRLNQLTPQGLQRFSPAGSLSSLKELDLHGIQCGSAGILALCTTNSFPSLESLNLEIVGMLDPATMVALANNEVLPCLRELHLWGEIDSEVAFAWRRSGLTRRLQVLKMSCKNLSDVVAQEFWQAGSWPNLHTLKWSGTIPSAAVVALAECFGSGQLKELRLSDIQFDDAGVDALVRSKLLERLTILEMTDCELTTRQAKALAGTIGSSLYEIVVDRHFKTWTTTARLLPVPRARLIAATS